MYSRKQNRVFRISLADRRRISRKANNQLGRYPLGESTGRTMGRAIVFSTYIIDGSITFNLFRIQGKRSNIN